MSYFNKLVKEISLLHILYYRFPGYKIIRTYWLDNQGQLSLLNLESNYDDDMLRTGYYPPTRIRRNWRSVLSIISSRRELTWKLKSLLLPERKKAVWFHCIENAQALIHRKATPIKAFSIFKSLGLPGHHHQSRGWTPKQALETYSAARCGVLYPPLCGIVQLTNTVSVVILA